MALRFDTKDPAESVPLTFDFSPGLTGSELLTGTPAITVTTLSGTDTVPAAILNGVVGFDSTQTKVVQPVTGGVNNCDYQFVVVCPTTNSQKVLTIVAILPVRR